MRSNRKSEGQQPSNKYLKKIKGNYHSNTSYTLTQIYCILEDKEVQGDERKKFLQAFNIANARIEKRLIDFDKPVAVNNWDRGTISVLNTKKQQKYFAEKHLNKSVEQSKQRSSTPDAIPIVGWNDIEVPYEEVVRLAFDINTPDKLANQYQILLKGCQKYIKTGLKWENYTFVMNPGTEEIRAWW